ncbi:MAG: sensor domain-containing diguanylate cyclase [Candidatus Riflebacteria bacterium]|nr:sensor domain-containing diguanylate cyclase [Candidatus Riflebacteria bacterium]
MLFSFVYLAPILFFHSVTGAVAGGNCVSLDEGLSTYNLDGAVSYYEDRSASLSLPEILDNRFFSWASLRGAVPSFGFSSSVYWLKFDMCQPRPEAESAVLEINNPLLDSIDLFAVAGRTVVYDVHTGDSIPFSQRPEKHHNFLFFLPSFPEEALSIYLRVQTRSAVQVPLQLYTSTGFFIHNQRSLLVQGGYFGIILAMILYNAFLFFSLLEWPYLFYVFFTISFFSFQGVFQGFFQQFVFDSAWWQNYALLLFGFISIIFANLFADSFLNLPSKNPVVSRCLRCIGVVSALAAGLVFAGPSYALMIKLMLALAIPSSLLIMSAGFKLWWIGHLPARIFTLAWSTLLLSFVLASFNKFGLLPRVFWTEDIMQIGGVLEVVLLSIALGERINEEKRQRILAEQSLSSSLEEKVRARTLELNQALAQLETANAILDKMSLTDSLTQIANRRSFDNHIEIEFKSATRGGHPLALIMIDLDHFKTINDTHGHQVGDQVLQLVAEILCSFATRPRDKVFRYGGEEFAVVLFNTPLPGAIILAEKMRRAIDSSPLTVQGESCVVTISAGISVYDPTDEVLSGSDLDDLIRQADSQLYRAKANGRNRIEAFGMDNKEA